MSELNGSHSLWSQSLTQRLSLNFKLCESSRCCMMWYQEPQQSSAASPEQVFLLPISHNSVGISDGGNIMLPDGMSTITQHFGQTNPSPNEHKSHLFLRCRNKKRMMKCLTIPLCGRTLKDKIITLYLVVSVLYLLLPFIDTWYPPPPPPPGRIQFS
jgi:hypothetical protein